MAPTDYFAMSKAYGDTRSISREARRDPSEEQTAAMIKHQERSADSGAGHHEGPC